MTAAGASALYDEIGGMQIEVELDPILGPAYFHERLNAARRMQDRSADILSAVTQEQAKARMRVRGLRAEAGLTRNERVKGSLTEQIIEAENELDECVSLMAVVKLKRENLRQIKSDIRLILQLHQEERHNDPPPQEPPPAERGSQAGVAQFEARVRAEPGDDPLRGLL